MTNTTTKRKATSNARKNIVSSFRKTVRRHINENKDALAQVLYPNAFYNDLIFIPDSLELKETPFRTFDGRELKLLQGYYVQGDGGVFRITDEGLERFTTTRYSKYPFFRIDADDPCFYTTKPDEMALALSFVRKTFRFKGTNTYQRLCENCYSPENVWEGFQLVAVEERKCILVRLTKRRNKPFPLEDSIPELANVPRDAVDFSTVFAADEDDEPQDTLPETTQPEPQDTLPEAPQSEPQDASPKAPEADAQPPLPEPLLDLFKKKPYLHEGDHQIYVGAVMATIRNITSDQAAWAPEAKGHSRKWRIIYNRLKPILKESDKELYRPYVQHIVAYCYPGVDVKNFSTKVRQVKVSDERKYLDEDEQTLYDDIKAAITEVSPQRELQCE